MDHKKFAGFAPKPSADTKTQTAALLALTVGDRLAVDRILKTAVAHGGADNDKTRDYEGFMYARSFCDPDGHVFEPVWMNPDAVT